jgi:hypothetical protein
VQPLLAGGAALVEAAGQQDHRGPEGPDLSTISDTLSLTT